MKKTRTKNQALALLILSVVMATFSLATGQGLPYDKNYTTTKTARVSGITTLTDLNSRPVSQVNTSISYTDGFGRPLQGIAVGASPSDKDIIQPYGYDAVGRQAKSYLPYTKTTANGLMDEEALVKNSAYTQSSQYTFYNGSTATIKADAKPYSENIYTNNRITETYGPGAAWTTGKSAKSEVTVNSAGEVRYWQIEEGAPISFTYWPASTIYISEVTDEEGTISKNYTDSRGQTVLQSSGGVNTYYVYDDFGNLRFILTPESVIDMPGLPTGSSADYVSGNFETSSYQSKSYVYGLNGSVTLKPGFSINASTQGNFSVTAGAPPQGIIDDYVFQYEYDGYNRLIKEKSPGADWVYYVYDQWDRLVMSQDGKQRAENVNKWSFTKYDFYNRPIMSGITTLSGTNTHTSLQAAAMASSGRYETETTSVIGYTLTSSFPSVSTNDVFTISYYDDYDFKANASVSASKYSFLLPDGFTGTQATSVKGQVTGSKTKILGTTTFLNTVVYYDKEGRTLKTITDNHLGGTDKETIEHGFTTVKKTLSEHDAPDYSSSLDILEEYTYDHVGRLEDTYQTIGSGTRTLLSSLVYNELGQVIENNVHSTDNGSTFLQSVDYRYNIRGWLTSINNSELSNDGGTTNNDTNDLFGMQMAYNETPVQVNGANTQQLYNGNISSLRWKSDIQKGTPVERAFGYEYDNRYQLDKAKFGAKSGTGAFNNENGYYNVDNLTYDNNGNIKTLKREGYWGSKTTIDNLAYSYDGNKVKNVEDSGNEAGFNNEVVGLATEYGYDENGNMEYDLNKTIVEIRHNEQGLVGYVEFESGVKVLSTYDAAGILLGKEVKEGTTTKYTADYVNGLVYENGDISFLHTAQGRAIPGPVPGSWEYEYYYTDHLGNIRLVYGYFKETDVYKATLEPGKAADETAFGNMGTAQANQPNHTLPDASDPVPNYSAKLNPYSSGPAVGPALMVPVTAGDVVNMETWARYNVTTGGVNSLVSNLASLVSSAFTGVSGVSEANRTTLSNAVPGVSGNIPNGGGNNEPKAYLNYILFDNSYAQSQFGYVAVSDDGYQTYERLTTGDLTMPVSGYLYIYVANESTANVDVWFDDLKIIHQKANNQLQVVGAKDYYPFGLPIAGTEYWNEARKSYKYGYQGIYSEQDSLTKWNTFALRSYDPALGRFISSDPFQQFANPYNGMGNNPANYVDPNGGFGWPVYALGAFIGGASAGIAAGKNGANMEQKVLAALGGAVVGGLTVFGLEQGIGAINLSKAWDAAINSNIDLGINLAGTYAIMNGAANVIGNFVDIGRLPNPARNNVDFSAFELRRPLMTNLDLIGGQRIPNNITLDNGNVVNITFGTTSDGVLADRLVDSRLVSAFREVLNRASDRVNFNTIHISATTNGHAGQEYRSSNHRVENGARAVDISRIDGVRMIDLGANNQVKALQDAIESLPNVRENFGPAFIHKLRQNYPKVTGHRDHIHFSINP